ncbi:MAG: F0F1 ATP synthase subunit B [Hyphomonadaceae bacterium]|nr:F0F1 ATP synthase subunit B [Hyphomonadaceae bacterium]MBC6412106.1 F0F1 ATP synthase subunit B [Hyphomonadaceae bacterium]
MYFDFDPGKPTLWIFVAVILFFIALLFFGVHKKVADSLDARAERIRMDINEARRLREEAQDLLASCQRKQKEAEKKAEEIIKRARNDADVMVERSRRETAGRLERRAALAEARIANAESQALSEVRARAIGAAIAAAGKILGRDMTAADHARLIDEGIARMGKSFR